MLFSFFSVAKGRLRAIDSEIRRHDHELQSKMAEDQDESPPALAVLEELRQVTCDAMYNRQILD